ncbi:hypothetical protein DLAC_11634 [Tieghemostelium lacteum]|uniref:Uncharacterized protein n=1 Tax=Tieghemostelium lacteum TaxID=361077 RepID=A0A151ZGE6_TIELA|nr:hypothetical protein DLAC_11634 [Tieghemostelium lacteum]|eukprot:KYQ92997.1 hypothetical protein DLAC_11634 [Tieghemostelium lacteum]
MVHIGLKFRNYTPRETTLVKYKIENAKVPPIVEEINNRLAVLEENQDIQISFTPKKINWDLKRDISVKLSKLEKKTERSIYQLLKMKLEAESNEENTYIISKALENIKY